MKELVKSPLGMDHYAFMKKFLNKEMEPHLLKLDDQKALETERALALEALNKELKAELDALNALLLDEKGAILRAQLEANIQKLKNVSETLSSPDKKKKYDLALEAHKPGTNLSLKVAEKGISLVALVPLTDIKKAFDNFVAAQKMGWKSLDGKAFPEGSFKSEFREGPPEMLILTFPDAASAKAFIKQLFENNMAMFPGGSQDINDFDDQLAAQQKEEASIQPTPTAASYRKHIAEGREEAAPELPRAPGLSPTGSVGDE